MKTVSPCQSVLLRWSPAQPLGFLLLSLGLLPNTPEELTTAVAYLTGEPEALAEVWDTE